MFLAEQGNDRSKELKEYWDKILYVKDDKGETLIPDIQDSYKRDAITRLLENYKKNAQERGTWQLQEAPTNVASPGVNIQNWDPVMISLIRRAAPNLIAFDVMGVQPMSGPTGLIFAIKSKYDDQGEEAMFNEPNETFSAQGAGTTGDDANSLTLVVNVTTQYVDTETVTLPGGMTGVIESGGGGGTGIQVFVVDTIAGSRVQPAVGDAVTGGTAGVGTVVAWHSNAMTTAEGESLGDAAQNHFNEMSFSIEKASVTAKTRALKAEYSTELSQDLKAIHGLDAETELSNMLGTEITAEINREMINTLYFSAKVGAQKNTTVAGTFNLNTDSNGRWSVERFKGLMIQLEMDANAIARDTRRGRGNIIIASSDVVTALSMAGKLDTTPALSNNLTVDDTGNTFAGVLNGRYKVYIDPYWSSNTSEFYVVGYKGPTFADQGAFYAPYVPLEMVKAVGENTFQPKIAFKTRYGVVANPFVDASGAITSRSNGYYRRVTVTNLM